jgi:hypothetical protein
VKTIQSEVVNEEKKVGNCEITLARLVYTERSGTERSGTERATRRKFVRSGQTDGLLEGWCLRNSITGYLKIAVPRAERHTSRIEGPTSDCRVGK